VQLVESDGEKRSQNNPKVLPDIKIIGEAFGFFLWLG
jgi:hypothetical protein